MPLARFQRLLSQSADVLPEEAFAIDRVSVFRTG